LDGLKVAGDILLRTDRLYLRRFGPGDAHLFFELDSDPEVMRFISRGEPTSLEKIEKEILPRVLGYYTHDPPQGCWAAHLLDGDEFMGWFHLRADRIEPGEIELGYRLRRSAWGRGLATEGSRALVRQAFTSWGYPKVCARTLVNNRASQRVMEKAGLHFEREFIYGTEGFEGWSAQERQAVKYSLTRRQFQTDTVPDREPREAKEPRDQPPKNTKTSKREGTGRGAARS
jgi:RimJ/RimL family protein N-acetyltransferase